VMGLGAPCLFLLKRASGSSRGGLTPLHVQGGEKVLAQNNIFELFHVLSTRFNTFLKTIHPLTISSKKHLPRDCLEDYPDRY